MQVVAICSKAHEVKYVMPSREAACWLGAGLHQPAPACHSALVIVLLLKAK